MKQMAEMHLWMNMLIKKVSKHIKTGFVKFERGKIYFF